MKKLIAVLAMVALVSGAAFAQFGGHVIGTVNVLENGHLNSDGDKALGGSADLGRIRINGAAENDDGTFGGWLRFDSFNTNVTQGTLTGNSWEGNLLKYIDAFGLVWWKPIQQVKLTIGGNPDGFYEKAGVTTWMFYQMISDTGVVNPGNAWGGGYGAMHFRDAFYGGFGGNALMLDIKPINILGINVILPYFDLGAQDNTIVDILKAVTAQVDLNLDFGNIAVTYRGDNSDNTNGKLFAYFSLSAIDNLGIDVGASFTLPGEAPGRAPINIGLGFKFGADAFGIKARVAAGLAGTADDDGNIKLPTTVLADLLPYYALSDSLRIFASLGLAMEIPDGDADSVIGFHVNPYVEIGNEWGPTFYVGFRLWSDGSKDAEDKLNINWKLPIAIGFSF